MSAQMFGEYIVSDPKICEGKPVFKGTNIPIEKVLEQVANDMDWESIVHQWSEAFTKEAIAEAVYWVLDKNHSAA